MHEVTSRNDSARTRKFIIGKPAITPTEFQEVDLKVLGAELSRMQRAFSSMEAGDEASAALAFQELAEPQTGVIHALIAELTDEHVQLLQHRHGKALIIEEDQDLQLFGVRAGFEMSQIPVPASQGEDLKITLKVVDESDAPIQGVRVDLSGELWSDTQITNTRGQVTLKLMGETLDSLVELRLKPASGFWSRVIDKPAFATRDNVVRLIALPADLDGPQANLWGHLTLGKVSMPEGAPVRVAVIDSGFADGHPDVVAKGGRGFAEGGNPEEDWRQDDSGHGTHVAGTIGALNNAIGMQGVADKVEIFPLRIFPGASVSKLMAAIDAAIEMQVDVVNMSLGGPNPSQLLRQRMQAARAAGILLVAAAGNSGGSVMYPAAYDEVMAVAAIGKHGSFPEDSLHSRHVSEHVSTDGSYFAAGFSCRGPEIDVCAPGVAVISTVPGPGFASFDGTSMASPHIAGIAAVLLAQNPELRAMARNRARSDGLFQKVLSISQPLGLPAELQGKGLPILEARPEPAPGPEGNLDMVAQLIQKALEAARAIKEAA